MTKAEMENHRATYHALLSQARLALQEGHYDKAVKLASHSLDHVDGMMQYERKYEGREFDSIEAIDIVLRYAPLSFDYHVLDTLEILLKSQRRIDKHASDDLAGNLSDARKLMWKARLLWECLERSPERKQDDLYQALGGDQEQWRSIAGAWEKMGLVHRIPEGSSYRLALSTQLQATVLAKCISCGVVCKAPKATLLEAVVCPKCKTKVMFVFLSREASATK